MPYTKHVVIPTYGKITGTSITGSYQTVLTATNDAIVLFVFNSCDEALILSLDGGTTDHFELDSGESFDIDLRSNDYQLGKPTVQVKKVSDTPTSGSIRVTVLQV